jgi:hypothetical protein
MHERQFLCRSNLIPHSIAVTRKVFIASLCSQDQEKNAEFESLIEMELFEARYILSDDVSSFRVVRYDSLLYSQQNTNCRDILSKVIHSHTWRYKLPIFTGYKVRPKLELLILCLWWWSANSQMAWFAFDWSLLSFNKIQFYYSTNQRTDQRAFVIRLGVVVSCPGCKRFSFFWSLSPTDGLWTLVRYSNVRVALGNIIPRIPAIPIGSLHGTQSHITSIIPEGTRRSQRHYEESFNTFCRQSRTEK